MNETIVTVVGNVASELRVRRVGADEERVVGFRVASSERRWDRETEAWIDGDRFSAWVSCWRKLGDGVARSLVKGDPVVVAGRLSVREYEMGGERRFSTEIAATAVGPDLSRSTATVTRRRLVAVPGSVSPEEGAAPADPTPTDESAAAPAARDGGGSATPDGDVDDDSHDLADTVAIPGIPVTSAG